MIYSTFNPGSVLDYINSGGLLVVFIILAIAGAKKWWVFGWYYTECGKREDVLKREADEWKEIALRSTNLAETLRERQRLSP